MRRMITFLAGFRRVLLQYGLAESSAVRSVVDGVRWSPVSIFPFLPNAAHVKSAVIGHHLFPAPQQTTSAWQLPPCFRSHFQDPSGCSRALPQAV